MTSSRNRSISTLGVGLGTNASTHHVGGGRRRRQGDARRHAMPENTSTRASIILFDKLNCGDHFKEAILHCRKKTGNDGKALEFLKITMKHVTVSNVFARRPRQCDLDQRIAELVLRGGQVRVHRAEGRRHQKVRWSRPVGIWPRTRRPLNGKNGRRISPFRAATEIVSLLLEAA